MTDKKRNLIVSFLFMAFGVFLLVESMGIKHMMKNDVGSGFFPKIIAIVMIAVSVIRLIMTLLEPSGETEYAYDRHYFYYCSDLYLYTVYLCD